MSSIILESFRTEQPWMSRYLAQGVPDSSQKGREEIVTKGIVMNSFVIQGRYFVYMFRKPKYPMIGNINGVLICGRDERQLFTNLANRVTSSDDKYDLFDANGDAWQLSMDEMVIASAFSKRKWTKMRLIELFNSSQNSKIISQQYSTKSLSSKKLSKIFLDILELVEASLRNRLD